MCPVYWAGHPPQPASFKTLEGTPWNIGVCKIEGGTNPAKAGTIGVIPSNFI